MLDNDTLYRPLESTAMIEANNIITESLSPAVALSGIGLLIFGLNNRIATIGTRVRELNRELRHSQTLQNPQNPPRRQNIEAQIRLFLKRAYIVRNAMFLLFGAMAMMVLTAVALALSRLHFYDWELVPAYSFLGGLLLMLAAVVMEGYEIIVNLETLHLDVDNSIEGQRGEPKGPPDAPF